MVYVQCPCSLQVRNMSPSPTVWLADVFLIVFGQQWSSVVQSNKVYQAKIDCTCL